MKRILVTGGCGFIGQNFINNHMSDYPTDIIVNFDSLTYAADRTFNDRMKFTTNNYFFDQVDITNIDDIKLALNNYDFEIDVIIHFAAETHVDNSIEDGSNFIKTNVLGTYNLLNIFRTRWVNFNDHKFIYISTDEIYGDIAFGSVMEDHIPNPRNPYSASKLSGEMICQSFFTTYNFPIVITRSCNNFGQYQYPEKFIPISILRLLTYNQLQIYGDGRQERNWINVNDNCSAIEAVIETGLIGTIYNISTDVVMSNLTLARIIIDRLNLKDDSIEFIVDRPGHDRRYSINNSKIRYELHWSPKYNTFDEIIPSINDTIDWYVNNQNWFSIHNN